MKLWRLPLVGLTAVMAWSAMTVEPATAAAQTVCPAGGPAATRNRNPATVRTIPPVAGAQFTFDGVPLVTGADGLATILDDCGYGLEGRLEVVEREIQMSEGVRARVDQIRPRSAGLIEVTFNLEYLVSFSFVEDTGTPVDPALVASFTLKSSTGSLQTVTDKGAQWLHGSRVISLIGGLQERKIYYTVEDVIVEGSNVVNRSQQRLFPSDTQSIDVQVLFFSARFKARHAFFGFPRGTAIQLTRPDGTVERHLLDRKGELVLNSLPRGDYKVVVEAKGMKLARPVSLSRDQDVDLKVISWMDIGLVLCTFYLIAVGLLLARRPSLRRLRRAPKNRPLGRARFDPDPAPRAAEPVPAEVVSAHPAPNQAAPTRPAPLDSGPSESVPVGVRERGGNPVDDSLVDVTAPPANGSAMADLVDLTSDADWDAVVADASPVPLGYWPEPEEPRPSQVGWDAAQLDVLQALLEQEAQPPKSPWAHLPPPPAPASPWAHLPPPPPRRSEEDDILPEVRR